MATVRPGTEADLPLLRRIQTAALTDPWPDLLDLALENGGPELRVVDDGSPVGYVVAMTAAAPVAYVPELAVEPTRQGEGLGSALLESLLGELDDDGVGRVRLTARADDDRVRSFYRVHGFEPVDHVADHFEDGDGVVLQRQF
jgi:ribosomal-protein-alanine N-acetyltransferase